MARLSQTLPDLSKLRLTADIPFHTTNKTLNDLPVDILARIIKHVLPKSLVVRADNPLGRWQHDWRPMWLPRLRLVTKKIGKVAEEVISINAGLSACDWEDTGNSLQALYRKQHEKVSDSPKWGSTRSIELANVFPVYLMSNVKHFRLCLNRQRFSYRYDSIDLSIFPNLIELEITAGDPAKDIMHYAMWLGHFSNMSMVKKGYNDKRVTALKKALDEVGVMRPELLRTFANCNARRVQEGKPLYNQASEDMYNYTMFFRIGWMQVLSAKRLFRLYTTEVLGIDSKNIKGWRPDMLIRVHYADEMSTPQNAEEIITVWITESDYGTKLRSEALLNRYANYEYYNM
ncbi:uncharacterized protein AB675_1135 [Cyphellophora attinorum]|uniref:F-box domain-containing protein n=1 Tax=Cyphellophora attinorum TaxID=1664694 RepID=A0A0N1NZA5_9EURO|nr:uncharacterized protein AB675_1135 [Phialophora attinorum]KPI38065.1 hypothetical protein AB675_1135 [Phialophora attinorum]